MRITLLVFLLTAFVRPLCQSQKSFDEFFDRLDNDSQVAILKIKDKLSNTGQQTKKYKVGLQALGFDVQQMANAYNLSSSDAQRALELQSCFATEIIERPASKKSDILKKCMATAKLVNNYSAFYDDVRQRLKQMHSSFDFWTGMTYLEPQIRFDNPLSNRCFRVKPGFILMAYYSPSTQKTARQKTLDFIKLKMRNKIILYFKLARFLNILAKNNLHACEIDFENLGFEQKEEQAWFSTTQKNLRLLRKSCSITFISATNAPEQNAEFFGDPTAAVDPLKSEAYRLGFFIATQEVKHKDFKDLATKDIFADSDKIFERLQAKIGDQINSLVKHLAENYKGSQSDIFDYFPDDEELDPSAVDLYLKNFLAVIKGLLMLNPVERLSIKEACTKLWVLQNIDNNALTSEEKYQNSIALSKKSLKTHDSCAMYTPRLKKLLKII